MKIPQPGDKGNDVRVLQDKLQELEYDLPKFGSDGDYGNETIEAVKQWQSDEHIDGTLDDDDWTKLFAPRNEPANKMPPVPNGQKEVEALYGKPWVDRDGWWRKWCGTCVLPAELKRLTKSGKIYVNKDLAPILEKVFAEIVDMGLASHIKSWDGCYNPRKKRGSKTQWSTHTWGLAIDLNAEENGLGKIPKMHEGIIKIFESYGFKWGGDFSRKDGMHFQRVTGF